MDNGNGVVGKDDGNWGMGASKWAMNEMRNRMVWLETKFLGTPR